MPRPRTTYTAEYKLAAVKMITEQKLSVAEVARRLDVSAARLRAWRQAALAGGDAAFPGRGSPAPADEALRRLRAETARLRAERDLLKKPPRTSPTRRPDVPVHRRARRRVAGPLDVRGAGGVRPRVRRSGRAPRQPDRGVAAGAGRGHRAGPRPGEGPVREPAHGRRVERPRARVLGEHGAELMREHGIRAKPPRRLVRTPDSNHRLPVAASALDRDFDPEGPNESWCADVTYLPTREGWLYSAVVADLFSRMIVGWSMGDSMESRLVADALGMAARRRPGAGLLAHADRGSRYASAHDRRRLAAEGIVCRVSDVGPCGDNAPVESFFGRLKCEIASGRMFATRDQARAELFEYLEAFYNRVRRHSSLGLLSPEEFERACNPKRR